MKKEYRLISVAIIVGLLGVGAFMYLNSEEPHFPEEAPIGTSSTPIEGAPETVSPDPGTSPETPETLEAPAEVNPEAVQNLPNIDPGYEYQQKILSDFKSTALLEVSLPPDFRYQKLDLDGPVAAIEGVSPRGDRKLIVMASTESPTPGVLAEYLRDQRYEIPTLADHEFKITGKVSTVEAPPGKGISKITIIPGGEKNGAKVYAAHLQRTDGKGSYVFIMRASQNYFDEREEELDLMLDSLSAK